MWKTLSWVGRCADGNGRRFEKDLGQKTALSYGDGDGEKGWLSLRKGIPEEECPGKRIMS